MAVLDLLGICLSRRPPMRTDMGDHGRFRSLRRLRCARRVIDRNAACLSGAPRRILARVFAVSTCETNLGPSRREDFWFIVAPGAKMKQKSGPAEEKIRIVLEGLRGEENISELCRREGIAASMCGAISSTWRWSFPSCRRGSWPCASPTNGSILYPKLRSIGC
jgi:hypothetical protein